MSDSFRPSDMDSLCEEFEFAWKLGQTPSVEEYLNRVDDSQRADLLTELLQIELWWRRGDPATVDEYRQRFPELKPSVDAASVRRRLRPPLQAVKT